MLITNKSYSTIGLLLRVLPALFFCVACVNTRKATYFDISKDASVAVVNQQGEALIQDNDLLSITVSSLSPEASLLYNSPNSTPNAVSMGGGNGSAALSGYLVNEQGLIQFPVLGNIKAAGMTKNQLATTIAKNLTERKLLLDPIVSVRNINFKVTVLGEVGHPTVINVPTEKITLLEAIGFAGDLTLYAKRDRVLLIREENGKRTYKLLNLNSNEIFTSPYYYLRPDDVIYVEPTKAKISSISPATQWLPVVFSALSVVAIFLSRKI